jgi:HEAT repeat protein
MKDGLTRMEMTESCVQRICRWPRVAGLIFLLAGLPAPASGAEVEYARDSDPVIEVPVTEIKKFSLKLKPLWLEALARPEADLARQAAQAIARAHRLGMSDLADTAGPLVAALEAPEQRLAVKLAAVQALVEIGARHTAPVLAAHAAKDGVDMAQAVEPALARWDYRPLRAVWLSRLDDPRAPQRLLVLAIQCVQTAKETKAAVSLRRLALDPNAASDLRVEAARALGGLQPQGLEDDARRLAADKTPQRLVDRLAAASMIRYHRGQPAVGLLLECAVDPEPAVAAIALRRLLEIDPMLAKPVIRQAVASPDSQVRQLAAEILVGQATPEAVALLGTMLDDPHPGVRTYAQASMITLAARAPLDGPVRQAAMKMLMTDRPRGLEQASLVLGTLDHKPAADRLVQLLEFPKPKVYITAAWALCRLAVPATAEPIFTLVRRETEVIGILAKDLDRKFAARPTAPIDIPPLDDRFERLNHLIQALGRLRHAAADSFLHAFLPKPPKRGPGEAPDFAVPSQPLLRAAAIWTLGHLHAGKPKADLAIVLRQRLDDTDMNNPESREVRCMSAVTLGRMGDRDSTALLQSFQDLRGLDDALENACRWALDQFAGGRPWKPTSRFREVSPMGWFLEPIEY